MAKALFLGAIILLNGCAGLLSPPTAEEIRARRDELAAAKIRLEAAEVAKTSNLEILQAEFQLAEAEFKVAQAKGVKESVAAGAHYTEVGARLLSGPADAAFPGLGAALSGVAMAAGVVRRMFQEKQEAPPPAGKAT